jgi:hypothetical protein
MPTTNKIDSHYRKQFLHLDKKDMTPEELVQEQLEAYNVQDLQRFVACFSKDVQVYKFPNLLQYSDTINFENHYAKAWAMNPNQKAIVNERMSLGNLVIDKEKVIGRSSGEVVHVIAMYKVEGGKITQVFFEYE